ncbi:MAG: TonB family protein [Acidobacteriota bacterium]
MAAPVAGSNGEPPTRSILGLAGLEPSGLALRAPPAGEEGPPPTGSLLGLQGLRRAPLSRPVVPIGEEGEPPPSLLGLGGVRPVAYVRAPRPVRPAAPPAGSSFFGLGGFGPGSAASPAAGPAREPASRSFFGMQGLPYAAPLASAAARASRPALPAEIEVPEFERDVEHRAEPAFPVERAVLASLAAHVLILLVLLSAPLSAPPDARKGLLGALIPREKTEEEKIPIIFKEAPGPERPNPKKSAPSDRDRMAAGGDPSKPRAQTPFVPRRRGIEGLAPGAPIVRQPLAPRPATEGAERQAQASSPSAQATGPKPEGGPDPLLVPPSGPSREGAAGAPLADLRQATRQAAREVLARGEGGSGFPNPDGGFVNNLGGVSFETSWYDWGPYAAKMLRRIKLHWKISQDLMLLAQKGIVRIRFSIMADGRVADVEQIRSSTTPPYDQAALKAILESNPFDPLPRDLLELAPGKDREHVVIDFIYYIDPAELDKYRTAQ